MKKIILGVGLLLAITAIILFANTSEPIATPTNTSTIGMTQIATNPALDGVRAAIISQLAKRGYVAGENLEIIFRNANGDAGLTIPIAQDLVAKQVDVLVPISTPSALAVAKAAGDIPVVFSGVSYPVEVGLVDSLAKPGGNITGTSDQWPFRQQIETYIDIVPETKTIGMLYKTGDDVAKRGLDAMRAMEEEGLFTLDARPISQPSDVYPTSVDLYRSVDVVYTGIDLMVAENINALLRASQEANKPLLGGDSGVVEQGAIMALSVGMEDIGRLTGDQIANVLEGASPSDIPVSVVSNGYLHINASAAEAAGIDLAALKTEYPEAVIVE